ncbi:MAG: hypothetical protein ACRD2Z_09865 [Thermoanaerobaculia bacterium]
MAASVKARLLAQAKTAGEEFERTLVRYAGERLLYRLGASSVRDRCILKGASLLAVWVPEAHRAALISAAVTGKIDVREETA